MALFLSCIVRTSTFLANTCNTIIVNIINYNYIEKFLQILLVLKYCNRQYSEKTPRLIQTFTNKSMFKIHPQNKMARLGYKFRAIEVGRTDQHIIGYEIEGRKQTWLGQLICTLNATIEMFRLKDAHFQIPPHSSERVYL